METRLFGIFTSAHVPPLPPPHLKVVTTTSPHALFVTDLAFVHTGGESAVVSVSADRLCARSHVPTRGGSRDLIVLFAVLFVALVLVYLWRSALFGEPAIPRVQLAHTEV